MTTSISIRIDQKLYDQARSEAQAEHRTIAGQVEYWAKVGRAALENPDLPVSFIEESLASLAEPRTEASTFVPRSGNAGNRGTAGAGIEKTLPWSEQCRHHTPHTPWHAGVLYMKSTAQQRAALVIATLAAFITPFMGSAVNIALPAIGYDALCTYALLGIPVVVFSNFTGLPVDQVGGYFARFMPVISTCIALAMLWIVGGWKLVWRGLIPTVLAGVTAGLIAIGMNALGMVTLTGVAAGLGVVIVVLAYMRLTGQRLVDRSLLNEADKASQAKMSLAAAISPWIFLTAFALLVNAPFLPFFNLTFNQWATPVTIIPGSPEKLRILWQAYFWILVSTLAALPWLKPGKAAMAVSFRRWLKRAPRPMLASAVFFAIAFIINHSGKNADWQLLDPANNMVYVIAEAASRTFGSFYAMVAPFLGLLAGFISGSETSAIAMLTAIHLSTAEKIGAIGLLIAAASGIGGGLASVISPAKLQNAAASIDRIGEEGQVLRVTFVISLAITAVAAILTMLWAGG